MGVQDNGNYLEARPLYGFNLDGEVGETMENVREGRKLNIAMLGHKRIPSREGGIEVVVEELSTRMVDKGHNVTCYNRKGHHVSGAEFDGSRMRTYKGVRLIDVPTINRKGIAAMTASIFASLWAAFGKYEVVHFHAEGPAFMCWLPKLCGKKVIVTVHGLDHQRAKWGKFASWYIINGERNAVRFADEIIVLSKGVQEYFLKIYGREARLIPNGVNRPTISEPKKIIEQFKLKKDGYILFLGRIVPEKGIKYLIEAFKDVKTIKKLVIAGGSSDSDSYMNMLKGLSKSDDRVIFIGFVQGKLLEELYSNCYIYVLPSDLEGMPLSLLEAMSYGNCCVTSDIDECREVVEDRAVVFKKSDVMDLKEKIQRLCDDYNTVIAYKQQAADFICRKYNWNDVVRETLILYK